MQLWLFAVDVVPVAKVLLVALRKADKNLIAPTPDAVVGRPAAEHALLKVDIDMSDGRSLIRRRGGEIRTGEGRNCDEGEDCRSCRLERSISHGLGVLPDYHSAVALRAVA